MAVTKILDIPNIQIDGVKIPDEIMGKAYKVEIKKEVGSIDEVKIYMHGDNAEILNTSATEFKINDKVYKLVDITSLEKIGK